MSRVDSTVRRALAITAAAALALSMAACSGSGGSSGKTVVWSTWGTPEELTRYKDFDTQFMKDHPDIKVVLQPVADYGDYHTKLLAQLASGTAPDVFYIGDDKIGQFVNSNALLPLTDLMNSSASKTKPEDFAPPRRATRSTRRPTTPTRTPSGTTRPRSRRPASPTTRRRSPPRASGRQRRSST